MQNNTQTDKQSFEQAFQVEIGEIVNKARKEREQYIGALMYDNLHLLEKIQQNFSRALVYATKEEAEEVIVNMKNAHILTNNLRLCFGKHVNVHVSSS